MKNNRTNQPLKNYQKKKYYINRNTKKSSEPQIEYYYNPQKKEWGSRISK